MKNFCANLGLVILSSFVTLILFIGGFELFENIRYKEWKKDFNSQGWLGKVTVPSSNPRLMWEYKPFGKFEEIEINRYGFRDVDIELENKPDDLYRVAFAGDSVTLGLNVDLHEIFIKQFETRANEVQNNLKVQALNFGVDGYNTPQILELIKTKILNFTPDKIVYILCLNDFDFSESSGLKILYFKKPESFFMLRLEALYRVFSGIDFHQFHFNKNHTTVFQAIADMKRLLDEKGIQFQVVVVPVFPEHDKDFTSYPVREIHSEISRFLTANKIDYIDLLASFEKQEKRPSFYASDIWHPNLAGHTHIANQLTTELLL